MRDHWTSRNGHGEVRDGVADYVAGVLAEREIKFRAIRQVDAALERCARIEKRRHAFVAFEWPRGRNLWRREIGNEYACIFTAHEQERSLDVIQQAKFRRYQAEIQRCGVAADSEHLGRLPRFPETEHAESCEPGREKMERRNVADHSVRRQRLR